MEIPPLLFVESLLLTSALFYAILRYGELLISTRRKAGKIVLLLKNPETGSTTPHYVKPLKNSKPGEEEVILNGQRIVLEGDARGTFQGSPSWEISMPRGVNLKAERPTDQGSRIIFWRPARRAETIDKPTIDGVKLAIYSESNPASYHRRMARTVQWGDALRANEEKPDQSWMAVGIIVVGVLVLCAIGGLIFLSVKISSIATHVGA